MPRPTRLRPREQVVGWPRAGIGEPAALVAQALAVNLAATLEEQDLSHRAAQRVTGVNHSSIGDILRGETWPDVETIARLESGLGADLWPRGVAKDLAAASSGQAQGGPSVQGRRRRVQ